MKKIKYYIILLIGLFLINTKVYAASASLSVSTSNVKVGESFTITVNASSVAAWNIHVNASGPVSNCSINQADATSDALDTNKSFSTTCSAMGEGTISISLSGDVTSASDPDNAVTISDSTSITAIQTASNNENNNSNNNSNNNQAPVTNTVPTEPDKNDDKKSKNNNVKEISIEGQKLEKIDNNNYTLSVGNSVTSIKINCVPEDNKAKVSGNGVHEINVGDNNIEIIVTSESGVQNKINIKVNRKEASSLDNLDELLETEKDINVNIKSDTVINSETLEKIKNSKKTVSFNLNDENNKLIYSIVVDGSKLDNTNEFSTVINKNPDSKKDILKKSNYSDGIYININKDKKIPKGVKIKLFVGDKYENNDKVSIYSYGKDLSLIKENVKVTGGYIEFTPDKNNDYLITMSKLFEETPKVDKSISIPTLVLIGLLSVLVILNIYVLFKKFISIRKQRNQF